jgi:hypothetical protein
MRGWRYFMRLRDLSSGSTVWFFSLWSCSPARAMASCGSAAQRGLWPPRSRGFVFTHNDAPHSVGLLYTSNQLVAETSTCKHTTHTTKIHASGGIWTQGRSRRATVDLLLRPRSHWDRRLGLLTLHFCLMCLMHDRFPKLFVDRCLSSRCVLLVKQK